MYCRIVMKSASAHKVSQMFLLCAGYLSITLILCEADYTIS